MVMSSSSAQPRAQALAKRLQEVASALAEELGYELVDLEFIDARRRPTVRVFIDKDGGVSLDDCTALSRRLGDRLDELNVHDGPYNLEVSSPGIERPFSTLNQYRRNVGKTIEVVLKEPIEKASHFRGELLSISDAQLELRIEKGETKVISLDQIRRANRTVEFRTKAGQGS
jgi:ribosome maturation factor RimP